MSCKSNIKTWYKYIKETHRVDNRLRKLLEAQLPVTVLISLHDCLVNDLLQLLILPQYQQASMRIQDAVNLQVVSDHHLQHQKEFAV